MTQHVFTYGSLMFDEVWSLVVERDQRSVPATLADHARFAVADQTYPGMVPSTGASVAGVVHLDVDDDDLERLDRFEGDDYRRETVTIVRSDGVVDRAQTYVYRRTDRLLKSPWEPDAFEMRRFIETYCRDRLG